MNATASGNTFSLSIAVVLVIAVAGLILWAIATGANAKAVGSELGKSMLWTGLVAFCIALSGAVLHC